MIDCQQNTGHLASLGAGEITRAEFERRITPRIGEEPPGDWTYHPAMWRRLLDPKPGTTRPQDTGT